MLLVQFILATILGVQSPDTAAGSIELQPPAHGFILDSADLIDAEDEEAINDLSRALSDDEGIPIVVVTIESMAAHCDYEGIRIETFALLLFDQWEIGFLDVDGKAINAGILLLVSRDDRKARIQLGAAYRLDRDRDADRIMQGIIVPAFKRGEFSSGIRQGVEALDKLGRGQELPKAVMKSRPNSGPGGGGWSWLIGVLPIAAPFLVIGLSVIGQIIRAFSSYREGVAENDPDASEGFWHWYGLNRPIISFNSSGSRSSSRSSWSGFGGGGFSSGGGGFSGGGFSGGGGSTGSW